MDGAIVREGPVRIHVNGSELATVMCTPAGLDFLALGLLRGQGIIDTPEDVRLLNVCPSRACVEVWLHRSDLKPASLGILTSGCGGGTTFADTAGAAEPLQSDLRVTSHQIRKLMEALREASVLHREVGGIHTAALGEGNTLLAVAEDIGRHNTIDKLWGRCLVERIPTQDRILLSTGRISSEMLYKAAGMRTPVVVSRTSPTTLSVALAKAWHMTLIGYVRLDSMNVYAGQERIMHDEEEQSYANS